MKRMLNSFFIIIVLLGNLVFLLLFYFIHFSNIIFVDNISYQVSEYINDDLLYDLNINYNGNKDYLMCSIDNTKWKSIDNCKFSLKSGKHKIYFKRGKKRTLTTINIKNEYKGKFTSQIDMLDVYYLAKGGKKKIDFEFSYPSDFDKTIIWKIENNNIIEIKDNTIYGKNNGSTKAYAYLKDGNFIEFSILVTDLITKPTLNNNKSYLPCERYSEEESILLDKILASRVKEAGEGTRGGVLAAARFLTLEFKYALRYFNENGRLVDHGYRPHIDGEGRYYHKGLYLSKSKYKELEKGASTKTGPKIWGCKIYDRFVSRYNMNGFTCSGFVTWAMLNGGFDVGDVGAGNYKQFNDDLSDLGPHHEITTEYMKNGNYKVGDFIARNGHAALIIGIDEKNIYTAESLPPKLKVYIYGRYSGIVKDTNLTYVIEMSDIYPNGDGKYTNMW